MQTLKLKLKSKGPAMMSSERMANPLDPLAKEKKKFTAKRVKSDEDHEQIQYLDFKGQLYHDDELGPYWPATNLLASIRASGRLSKQGKLIEQGVWTDADKLPLKYSGPRDIDGLYKDARFRDVRSVVMSGRRTMACRPVFPEWECSVTLLFDEAIIERPTLLHIVERAGSRTRIGTYRSAFGQFCIEEVA